MKKFNDKTTVDRLFNGLLREQGMWYLCKVLLCLFLFLSGTAVCAQSNDSILIVFEKVPVDDKIKNDELPKRDLELEAILPTAMYDVHVDVVANHISGALAFNVLD